MKGLSIAGKNDMRRGGDGLGVEGKARSGQGEFSSLNNNERVISFAGGLWRHAGRFNDPPGHQCEYISRLVPEWIIVGWVGGRGSV